MSSDRPPPHPGHAALVQQLLGLYARGEFLMADVRTGEVGVYDPHPRGVLPLDGMVISRSLRQRLRQRRFTLTTDLAFDRVLDECADPAREGAWIDTTLHELYRMLHRAGHAHSIEAWLPPPADRPDDPPTLVGGLFGVHLRGLFAGESMFSLPNLGGTDASKVALVALVQLLSRMGVTLIDTQFVNPHMASLGAIAIPRRRYKQLLAAALDRDAHWPGAGSLPPPS